MKRKLVVLFILLFTSNIFSLDLKLYDSSKTFNTRTDGNSNVFLYFFENNPLLVNSQKSEIFINNQWVPFFDKFDDKEILETYAKYGVTVQSFIDDLNKNYYLEITSYVDKSLYFCFRFYIENNQLKKEKIEFESFSVIKNSLLNPWQDFPIRLLDNSQLEFYSKFIEFGKYETIFQISNNKKIIDVIQLLSEYEILSRPCINDKKNLLIFYGCPYENIKRNLFNDCQIFIFSIIYDATVNDFRVRLRSEPNLSCETLGYLEKGDAVKIVDRSDEKFEIDGENWYWYQVKTTDEQTGWVYGKYLDIENE